MSFAYTSDPYSALDLGQPIRTMSAVEADALAARVSNLLAQLTVPIAHKAREIVENREWQESGWALARDWSLNELSRDERWLRFMAALGRALQRWPQLAGALTGADGGRPIGAVAAVQIARVADDASLAAWIALARSLAVRALKDAVRNALSAGSAAPLETPAAPGVAVDEPSHVRVQLNVVSEAAAAWAAGHELHDAISGHHTTSEEFVEALVAEFEAGIEIEDRAAGPLRAVRPRRPVAEREREAEREAVADGDAESIESAEFDEVEREALAALSEPERTLPKLLRAEELCRILLGRLLARLAELRPWRSFGYASLVHYAEGRLGISGSTAARLARLARECRAIPALADEYESGLLGAEKTRLVLERFRGERRRPIPRWSDEQLLASVIESVRGQTCRRSADENRVWRRASSGRRAGVPASVARAARRGHWRCGRPLTDAEWQSSLRRGPQATYDEIIQLAKEATISAPVWTRLELRLEIGLAERFLACLDAAHPQLDGDVSTFSVRTSLYSRSLGLFAMLISYASQWDPPASRHAEDRPEIYRRDGYRCTAPGCTCMTGLHRHHVRYRSQGGDDSDANQTTLCAFHHQDGEHGGLMSVCGEAPLELVFRLGRAGSGCWYQNDRRLNTDEKTDENGDVNAGVSAID